MSIGRTNAVLLIGPTASGKTPLGELIARNGINGVTCHHFDFGAELRNIASGKGGEAFTAREVRFVRAVIEDGLLLEDEQFPLARKIIRSFIASGTVRPEDLLVLNGLPRHGGQAERMEDIVRVRALFVLECDEKTVLGRIRDDTGGDRGGREDDREDLVMRKIAVFRKRTLPLISFYEERGANVISVCVGEGVGAADILHELLLRYSENPSKTR